MSKIIQLARHKLTSSQTDHPVCNSEYYAKNLLQLGNIRPVKIFQGMLIDGWEQYAACLAVGVEPWLQELNGSIEDVAAHYLSDRIAWAGGKIEEKMFAAAKIAIELESLGMPRKDGRGFVLAVLKFGYQPLVTAARLKSAHELIELCHPSLITAIEQGRISLTKARKVGPLLSPEQQRILCEKFPERRITVARIKRAIEPVPESV